METIGDRIKVWRRRRRMSQAVLAGLAGISQPYISQLEGGSRSIERRATLAAIAEALQVSVSELTGAGEPGDPVKDRAAAAVPAIRSAIVMREADELGPPAPPDGHETAKHLGTTAEYATLAAMLPQLLSGATGRPFVHVVYETVSLLKHLGEQDLSRDAARLGLRVAQDLGDPALIGVAAFLRAHALPAETPGLAERVADAAANELQPYLADRPARETYGMLHLTAGLRAAAAGHTAQARAHLDEAASEAATLGDPDGAGYAWMCFGPTNVSTWRMIVGNELGDVDSVLAAAERTQWRKLPTVRRQASYHIERGRALATVGGRDEEATLAFLRAEEIAPQYTRLDTTVRDTASTIRRRTRDAAMSRALRRLSAALDLT